VRTVLHQSSQIILGKTWNNGVVVVTIAIQPHFVLHQLGKSTGILAVNTQSNVAGLVVVVDTIHHQVGNK